MSTADLCSVCTQQLPTCHPDIALLPKEPVASFAYTEKVKSSLIALLDQAHSLMSPSHDEVTTFDYRVSSVAQSVCARWIGRRPEKCARTYLLVRQPRMADDDLLVRAVEAPVNPARLEVPKHHVALPVSR